MLQVGGRVAAFCRLVRLALIDPLEEGKEFTWRGPGGRVFQAGGTDSAKASRQQRVRNVKRTVRGRVVGNEVTKATSWDTKI